MHPVQEPTTLPRSFCSVFIATASTEELRGEKISCLRLRCLPRTHCKGLATPQVLADTPACQRRSVRKPDLAESLVLARKRRHPHLPRFGCADRTAVALWGRDSPRVVGSLQGTLGQTCFARPLALASCMVVVGILVSLQCRNRNRCAASNPDVINTNPLCLRGLEVCRARRNVRVFGAGEGVCQKYCESV